MCGIAGILADQGPRSRPRRADPRADRPPRARRPRHLDRRGRRHRPRPSPPRDRRPVARRPRADAFGRRALCPHLQRRDLQPPGAAQGARGRAARSRRRLARPFRCRGVSRGQSRPGAWPRRCGGASACSPSACGTARSGRSRLVRDRFGEKPLYYGWAGTRLPVRVRAQGLRAHPRFDNGDQPPGAQAVRRAHLHPGAAVDLRARVQAPARLHPDRGREAARRGR